MNSRTFEHSLGRLLVLGAALGALSFPVARADGIGSPAGTGSAGGFSTYGSFGGAGGGLGRGSSVIRSGTGISVYSQRGVSRHPGPPPVSATLYHPDGSSSRVVGDGEGGGYVYGPQVTHRLFPESPAVTASDR